MTDTDSLAKQLKEYIEKHDFEGAMVFIRDNRADIAKAINPSVIRDALKKTTSDRLLISFIDGVEFGKQSFDKSFMALEKLVSFKADALVLSDTWGLGKIRRLDYFYRRITVDFKKKIGHQFSFAAAVDMLTSAPEDHILVRREADFDAYASLLNDKPGEFVKTMIKSFGEMSLNKLEEVFVTNEFVRDYKFNDDSIKNKSVAEKWKNFWERARQELKKDGCAEIPVKRTALIRIKATAENYGDLWLTKFSHESDPKVIMASVTEFIGKEKSKFDSDEEVKKRIGERLAFAATAARKVDDALYARIACKIVELGFNEPKVEDMRNYLWERKRFIKAAAALPAREVGAMITLLSENDEARARLYEAIPALCYTAVDEIVKKFHNLPQCREAIGALMREPKAPPTLTTLIVGRWVAKKQPNAKGGDENAADETAQISQWKELPPLTTLLTHAIALGEGRQGGETLKMQNIIKRLFANEGWLKDILSRLEPAEKVLFFERFQASIAWDPSTHHLIVIRMTHLAPELESHIVKVEKKKEYARITSYRSFAMKKAEYLKLIKEDMPANVKRIEFAKGFGDLSENAEYQYAKDEQRALMQKQSLMQAELEAVKPNDFANVGTEEVEPGVAVRIDTKEGEKCYYILGEWDNDIELGILSSKTRLAGNMLGKKVGDKFEIPGSEEGTVAFGMIKAIEPLPENIRQWMKLPDGMQI